MKTCTGSRIKHCTEDLTRHLSAIFAFNNAENESLLLLAKLAADNRKRAKRALMKKSNQIVQDNHLTIFVKRGAGGALGR